MKKLYTFIISILIFGSFVSFGYAGDPGPLCDAVSETNDIFEVEIDGTAGKYSETYKKSDSSPEQKELKKIEMTAKIVKVYKGNLKVGDQYKFFEIYPYSGPSGGKFWSLFFNQKKIIVLEASGGLGGWMRDASQMFDFLDKGYKEFAMKPNHYTDFKNEVLACFQEKKK